ncbi:MAG: hypothetical protein AB1698_19705 [Pseudomonadota bacterium]
MCEVCAIFGAGEHWSDFGRTRDERYPFDDIMHFRKERARRLSLISRILGKIGATCEDWDGEAVAVHDRSGRFKLAATLNDIWPAAEALTGRRIDPLDLDFLPPSGRFSAEAA